MALDRSNDFTSSVNILCIYFWYILDKFSLEGDLDLACIHCFDNVDLRRSASLTRLQTLLKTEGIPDVKSLARIKIGSF